MKAQKKNEKQDIEENFGIKLTLDESLNKYSGPEFVSPKLEKAERKFGKQVINK